MTGKVLNAHHDFYLAKYHCVKNAHSENTRNKNSALQRVVTAKILDDKLHDAKFSALKIPVTKSPTMKGSTNHLNYGIYNSVFNNDILDIYVYPGHHCSYGNISIIIIDTMHYHTSSSILTVGNVHSVANSMLCYFFKSLQ